MGDCNHCTQQRPLSVVDDITVVFHKVDSHGKNSGGGDECGDDERTAETIHLQSNCRVLCSYDDDDEGDGDGDAEETRRSGSSPQGTEKRALCPPAFCVRDEQSSREGSAHEGNVRGAHTLPLIKRISVGF